MNDQFVFAIAVVYGSIFTWLSADIYYTRKAIRQRELERRERQERPRSAQALEEPYRRMTTEEWRKDFERRHGLS